MNNKIREKVIVIFMIFFAIGCLVAGKVYDSMMAYSLSAGTMSLLSILIIGFGFMFDIFKNPKVSKGNIGVVMTLNMFYPIIIIMNIATSNWVNVITFLTLSFSITIIFISNIKKEIKGTK